MNEEPRDRYTTVFLGVAGLVFAGTGLTFVLAPELVPAVAQHPSPSADAINDARAIYGAMELALGVFLGLTAMRARLHEAGLLAALLVGGLAALSRFVGFVLLEPTPVAHLAYGGLDLVGALFAAYGLRRIRGRRTSASATGAAAPLKA